MLSALIEGVLMGLFLSVFIGPVFFLLIETSINRGVRDAFIMDSGVILSDVLWILFLWWGIDKYLGFFLKSPLAMVFTGIIFVLFGVFGFFTKSKRVEPGINKKKNFFIQGFILNSINPSVALFWLATIGYALKQFQNEREYIITFFIAIFTTVLITDALKFSTAKKLSSFLNAKRKNRLTLITSVILVFFGLYMIIDNI
jgi:threonine/homoserine/homoserine lactone efflux protein